MSVEQRVRAGLAANTAHLRPDLDHEMALLRRRVHRRRVRRTAGVGLATLATAVAGILWLPGAVDAIRGLDDVTEPAIEQTTSTPVVPLAPPRAVAPGTYSLSFSGLGAENRPRAVIEVTSDAFGHDANSLYAGYGLDFRSIGFWTVAEIAANPCSSTTTEWFDPGPKVTDLAAALAAQPLKNATEPVPVSLGGYDGLYLETVLPTDILVADCAGETFVSWRSDDSHVRSHQGPGEIGKLWILDVDGHRLVVDVSADAGVAPDEVAELTTMVESITFE